MKVLIVGGGGREHALAWKLGQSPHVTELYVAPGNAGTQNGKSVNVPIAADDVAGLLAFARDHEIDLTVVGPELPLSLGVVDSFQSAGLRVFGPTQHAAQLETSKAFSKRFMREHGIPTAEFDVFTDYGAACTFIRGFGRPVVVKADGLAAGKGVIVCDSHDEAEHAARRMLVDGEFGAAGSTIVIEERLTGAELSVLSICGGAESITLPAARDHKRALDGDKGANTGGMGAFAPVSGVDDDLYFNVWECVIRPTLANIDYIGVLYAGLMLTPNGISVLEFNCRFGDPETQVLMPLLNADLYDVLNAAVDRQLVQRFPNRVTTNGACATVVLAAPGYPGDYPKGLPITGVDAANAMQGVTVFHAGTKRESDRIVSAGGRVLNVSAVGDDLDSALDRAYAAIEHIHFDGMHYRRDIGRVKRD
jgi:phosphoribosylamine---glycine ligase